jgi:transcriptional regulator with XRE-family HTH domain
MSSSREPVNQISVADQVRVAMITAGISRKSLAEITGLKPATISNLLAGNSSSKRGRRLIEAVLLQPFWHSYEEFNETQKSLRENGWAHVFGRWSVYRPRSQAPRRNLKAKTPSIKSRHPSIQHPSIKP